MATDFSTNLEKTDFTSENQFGKNCRSGDVSYGLMLILKALDFIY